MKSDNSDAEDKQPIVLSNEEREVGLELYKTAFQRLNFQDEYLFKVNTVFLTIHSILGTVVGNAVFQKQLKSAPLAVGAFAGGFLCVVWWLWIEQNDYWHSVWIGSLRQLEKQLSNNTRLFDANHQAIAAAGGRTIPLLARGHHIAQLMAIGIGSLWLVTLIYAV